MNKETLEKTKSEGTEKEEISRLTGGSLSSEEIKNQLFIKEKKFGDFLWPVSIIVASFILGGALVYIVGLKYTPPKTNFLSNPSKIESTSQTSVILPIKWGNLGRRLVEEGVIDLQKLESIYAERGGLSYDERKLLEEEVEEVIIDENNAGFILNLLWAFGLSNKNRILEEGPMNDPRYGGAGNFASTGGWILAQGSAMDHYSRHFFVPLTEKQQFLVEKVSQNIYRPCCNNSTYFPDCNHGMAMLGLLELMAANNITEKEMYKVALQVNSLWFPDTYAAIEQFLAMKGYSLNQIDPKEILSRNFSSISGYRQILSQINPPQRKGGNSCGV